mgnify:CR=1 FL=1
MSSKLFKLLSDEGRILESWWDMSKISDLESIDPERSQIQKVDVFLASTKSLNDIEELFEYIEEHEYTITIIN